VDVLEAAHIRTFPGEDGNRPANGLLLRADIHTLFDLDLLGIEPDRLRVELHPDVIKEYGQFAGKTLGCKEAHRPSREALQNRYEQFQKRLAEDGLKAEAE
jgi:putative restriction endonuclease